MYFKNTFSVLSVLGGAAFKLATAQSSSAYTDTETGISFQRFLTTSYDGFSFSIAFPTNPTTEFVGQIVGPIQASGGWSGVSLGGGMTNNLLVVAWPDGDKIIHSFRYVTGYETPSVYDGNATATTMYSSVNTTHFSWTFRCQNCVSWTDGGFDVTASYAIMGWAQSASAVTDITDAATTLQYHDNGFGQYGMLIGSAISDQYSAWIEAAGVGGGSPTSTMTPTAAAPSNTGNTTITTESAVITKSTTTTGPTTTTTAAPAATATLGEYDYIVVGGGAGGLVTADRLSETGAKVLLIERGPPSTFASGGTVGPVWLSGENLTRFDVPGLCNEIWVDSTGIACDDIDQMAGCLMGGGTAVNAGLFFRPQDRDWDYNFPEGWKATDMASATDKLFKRIPSTDTPSMDGKRYLQEPYEVLASALPKFGWKAVTANESPNSKNKTFSHTPFMYSNGERGGPLATYLQTAMARNNFELAINTTVRRVIRTGSTITGVEVFATNDGGQTGIYTVTENTGKVVLSAGTFGSAKILMRSGIGPQDSLEIVKSSTIDGSTMVAEDDWIILPVGYNVMDHANTDMVASHPNVTAYDFYGAYNDPIEADKEAYLNSRSGIFATAAPGPNTMLWQSFVGADGITRQLQWTVRAEGSLGETGDSLITISQYLGTGMTSRGRINIKSNLNMATTVSPYLRNEYDIDTVIQGVKSIMSSIANVSGITIVQPAAGIDAETFVNNYIENRRSNHWLGSAKMGTDDGRNGNGTTGAVVDTNAKVYGTDNLFVVDASVFPGHVATNPSAPIMIVAERAVERILALGSNSSTSLAATSKGTVTSTTIAVPSSTATTIPETAPTPSTTANTTSLISDVASTPSIIETSTFEVVPASSTIATPLSTSALTTPIIATASVVTSTPTETPTGLPAAGHYYQCGGNGWVGSTSCVSPYTCVVQNDYYSQCL